METRADEIARLQREIGERQMRLQRLVLGDPTKGVCGQAYMPVTLDTVGYHTTTAGRESWGGVD